VRGRLALLDGRSGKPCHAVELQYNPDRLLHTLQAPVGGEGRPLETFVLSTDLDATDGLESGEATAAELGIAHRLAAFRALAVPPAGCSDAFAVLELGARAVPVEVVELSVVEEAFDARLNPIRAVVTLTLVVRDRGPAAAKRLAAYEAEQARLARVGAGSG
jgi:hypothetical protein